MKHLLAAGTAQLERKKKPLSQNRERGYLSTLPNYWSFSSLEEAKSPWCAYIITGNDLSCQIIFFELSIFPEPEA
jgi:hypothetical protein